MISHIFRQVIDLLSKYTNEEKMKDRQKNNRSKIKVVDKTVVGGTCTLRKVNYKSIYDLVLHLHEFTKHENLQNRNKN